MSHTDIHRPLHALWLDPSMREHFKEHHDHTDGACDLEDFLAAFCRGGWLQTHCHVQWWSDLRICSCGLCSGRDARRRSRRQERHGARAVLQEAAAQHAAGDLDEDLVVDLRAKAW